MQGRHHAYLIVLLFCFSSLNAFADGVEPLTKDDSLSGVGAPAPTEEKKIEKEEAATPPPVVPEVKKEVAKKDDDEDAEAEEAETTIVDKTGKFAPIQIPKAKKTKPVLKKIPPSLPNHVVEILDTNDIDISALKLSRSTSPARVDLTYFLAEGDLDNDGIVKEIESGHTSASIYQNIFVKVKDASQKNYYVVKEIEKIPDPSDKLKNLNVTIVEVQGEIELVEKVNESENMYRAVVKRNIQPIELNSKLLVGQVPQLDISKTPKESTASFKVVGGEFHKDRWLLGSSSVVFINGGRNQGIHEGQSLAVFATSKNRNKDSKANMNDREIGTVKVVRVTENYSTVYLSKSTEEVLVGDEVGSRSVAMMTESAPVASDLKMEEEKSAPAPVDDKPVDLPAAPSAAPDSSPAPGSDELTL